MPEKKPSDQPMNVDAEEGVALASAARITRPSTSRFTTPILLGRVAEWHTRDSSRLLPSEQINDQPPYGAKPLKRLERVTPGMWKVNRPMTFDARDNAYLNFQ